MVDGSDSRRSPASAGWISRLRSRLSSILPAPLPQVSPLEAHQRASEALFLDVREPDEWRSGHIPGAVHIPLGRLAGRLRQLDPARPVIAVCRSGNRSRIATRMLAEQGFQVENLKGGMLAWRRAGLPVRTAGRNGRR